MNILKLRVLAVAAAVVACAFAVGQGHAQMKYPHKNVTLITHSSPGGGTDVYLREMVKHLGPIMGVSLAVQNVRGGSGAKAMAKMANSPADGSIFYGTTPTFINTSLLSKPKYTYKDLEPLVNIFLDPQVVYVRAESPFKSLKQVIEDAKARTGKQKWGTGTPGSLERQAREKLKKVAGVDVIVVTHDGGGDLLISVLNGTVDLGVAEVQELRGQLDAKKVRLIGSFTDTPLDNFPEVKTAKAQGIDMVVTKFRGIAGPKGLPRDVIKAWEAGIQKVLASPAFKKWYERGSLVPTFMPHAAYGKFIADYAKGQQAFFKEYGITKRKKKKKKK